MRTMRIESLHSRAISVLIALLLSVLRSCLAPEATARASKSS